MSHNILAYRSVVEWIWVGFGVGFYTFHPFYTELSWLNYDQPVTLYLVGLLFLISETMSLLSNIHLHTV